MKQISEEINFLIILLTIGTSLLPTYAARLRTTADTSTTPRGSLKSRML
jgi:hypothetical protein